MIEVTEFIKVWNLGVVNYSCGRLVMWVRCHEDPYNYSYAVEHTEMREELRSATLLEF